MEKPQPENTAAHTAQTQSPVIEPPAYFPATVTSPPAQPQGEIVQAPAQQPQPEQTQPQPQHQPQTPLSPIPDSYAQKNTETMNPHHNGIPLVTPINMLQGESPQWIDCPWCYQRTQVTVERHGTSMQMLTGILCCLFCVCLACVPCIAGWFEETQYSCGNCKKLVARRDDNGTINVFGPTVLVPSQAMPAQPQPAYQQQGTGTVPAPQQEK